MGLTFMPLQVSQQLSQWYGTPKGRQLLQETTAVITPWLSELTGYYAVKLSYFDDGEDWGKAGHIQSQLSVAPVASDKSHVASDFAMLPFDADSVDLVIAHHVFEFVDNPHALLREAHRILIPDGQCIIISFNPFGIYGAMKPFKRRATIPWRGHFFSSYRIRDWLSVLDFEVCQANYFAPPCLRLEKSHSRLNWLPTACRRYLPISGGLFALSATKHVMSPLIKDLGWRAPAAIPSGRIAPPTTSQPCQCRER